MNISTNTCDSGRVILIVHSLERRGGVRERGLERGFIRMFKGRQTFNHEQYWLQLSKKKVARDKKKKN